VTKKPAKKKATGKKPATRKKTVKKTAATRKSTVRKKAAAKKPASLKKAPKKISSRRIATAPKSRGRVATASRTKPRSDLLTGPIHGIAPYVAKRGENYMSKEQLEHFAAILNSWKRELMNEVDRTVHHMQDEAANFPDPNDRATQESEFGLELRTRDRERKLLRKINAAIARIEDGTYGYCEETGEEIGLKRLEARPVATLCLEAQERREMSERQFRDRDDRYR
jgi:DnaK suppressor protein